MVSFICGYHGSVGGQGIVDSGIGDQIGLELIQIHVEGAVKTEGGGDGGDDLGNEAVEVGVGGSLDVKTGPTNVINGLEKLVMRNDFWNQLLTLIF